MLHLYYGNGKGKTSAILGMIMRASGYNKKIVLLQFLKPKDLFCGEHFSLKKFTNVKQIRFSQQHPIFMIEPKAQKIKLLKTHVGQSLKKLEQIIKECNFDILILDEILNLIGEGYIKESLIIKLIKRIKVKKEIILSGRNKPNRLLKKADYVTEFKQIKHPFQKGILARKAIEF